MISSDYSKLEFELLAAGAPTIAASEARDALGPIATLVNSKVSGKPYAALLLEALPRLRGSEQEMVIRALSERGMPNAGPALVFLMNTSEPSSIAWALGNALAEIRDTETYPDVVALCGRTHLGTARQMLFHLLPTIGTEAAYAAAPSGLSDETVRGHALEALGRFGRREALPHILATATKKGLYEDRAKSAAVRRLERHNVAR